MKRSVSLFSLLLIILSFSCVNMLSDRPSTSIVFSIGEDTNSYILDTVKNCRAITDDSKIQVESILLKKKKTIQTNSFITDIKTGFNQTVVFNEVPFDQGYTININISYNDILIFSALSNQIDLSENNPDVTIDLTLKPHLSNITYKSDVKLDTENYPSSYFINKNISLPTPNIYGYEFLGWYLEDGSTKITTLGKDNYIGDVTLVAHWRELEILPPVSFSKEGAIEYNEEITISHNVAESLIYYTVDGSEPTINSELYTKPIKITQDVTIKAIAVKNGMRNSIVSSATFTVNKYTLTFDNGGVGEYTPSPITGLNKNDKIPLDKLTPLKVEGYTFINWQDSKGNVVDESYIVTESTVIIAQWDTITYNITYHNCNSEVINNNPSTYKVDTPSFNIQEPKWEGHTFGGWYTDSSLNVSANTNIQKGSTGNIDLYAKWDTITYNITYNNCASDVSNTNRQTYDINTPTFTIKEPSWKGHTFGGWYTDVSLSVSANTNIQKGSTGDIDLYAKWDTITYNITYHNCNSEVTNNNPNTFNVDTPTFTIQNPTWEGHTFGGWYTDVSLSASANTNILKGSTGNIDLYAKWHINKHLITYANLGNETINTKTVDYGYVLKNEDLPTNLTKPKFLFSHWENNGEHINPGYVVKKDIELQAQWTNMRTVEDVTFTASSSLDYGEPIELSTATQGATIYYTLDDSDPSLTTSNRKEYLNPITLTTDTLNIRAYAEKHNMISSTITSKSYTMKKYSVTFETNNMTSKPSSLSLRKGEKITQPNLSGVEGYEFDNWYKEKECKTVFDFETETMQTSPIQLYGKWTPITYTIEFDLNGGQGNIKQMTCTFDQSYVLPNYENNKSGYSSLSRWNSKPDGTGIGYDAGVTQTTNICTRQGQNVILYAQWKDDVPPSVSNLKAVRSDRGMALSWNAPNVQDIASYRITYEGGTKNSTTTSINITGLQNTSSYNFRVVAIDNGNNQSREVSISKNKMVDLSGYDTPQWDSGKTSLTYGIFPQSLKASNVTIDGNNTIRINNMTCYFGSDGNYYVKEKGVNPSGKSDYQFNDKKTTVNKNQDYYFKVEPIKWKTVYTKDPSKLLVATEKVISGSPYHNSSSAVTYENCTLRNYLNNDFVNAAFSSASINSHIPDTTIIGPKLKCFAMCLSDYNNYYANDNARVYYVTDYALGTKGIPQYTGQIKTTDVWTRSERTNKNHSQPDTQSYYVKHHGPIDATQDNRNSLGVQPSIWVKIP